MAKTVSTGQKSDLKGLRSVMRKSQFCLVSFFFKL